MPRQETPRCRAAPAPLRHRAAQPRRVPRNVTRSTLCPVPWRRRAPPGPPLQRAARWRVPRDAPASMPDRYRPRPAPHGAARPHRVPRNAPRPVLCRGRWRHRFGRDPRRAQRHRVPRNAPRSTTSPAPQWRRAARDPSLRREAQPHRVPRNADPPARRGTARRRVAPDAVRSRRWTAPRTGRRRPSRPECGPARPGGGRGSPGPARTATRRSPVRRREAPRRAPRPWPAAPERRRCRPQRCRVRRVPRNAAPPAGPPRRRRGAPRRRSEGVRRLAGRHVRAPDRTFHPSPGPPRVQRAARTPLSAQQRGSGPAAHST